MVIMKKNIIIFVCLIVLHVSLTSFAHNGNVLPPKDEDVVLMYAPDGRCESINVSDIQAWESVGWYKEPVTIMYAPDGRSEVAYISDIQEWINVGWYKEPVTMLYAPHGTCESVTVSDIQAWESVGWYKEPVTMMYAPDGRSEVAYTSDIQAWESVGWYKEPVTMMYAPDGRSEVAYSSDVQEWMNVGWYTEPVALMKKGTECRYVIESETEMYRREGWFISEYSYGMEPLMARIKQYVNGRTGSFGVYVKNLKTGEYMVLNDNQYSSASIIKLFVMAGIYNKINSGDVIKNDLVQKHLNSMITVSDNYSSNFLVKTMGAGNYLAGFNGENEHNESIGCINTKHRSLFSGCGDYVSYGRNVVSPYDCGLLLEKIYNHTLVSPEYSEEMLSMLKNQKRRSKIPYLLPKNIVCANKTGETSVVESDVGIVYSPNCDYIICVISNYARTGINDIRQISLMTYNYFN